MTDRKLQLVLMVAVVLLFSLIARTLVHAEARDSKQDKGYGITQAVNKQKGQNGEVTTLTSGGLDHPRNTVLDDKGNVWFIDGDQKTAKLKMLNGKNTTTVVDLVNTKANKQSHFMASGLEIMDGKVYVSSIEDVYLVQDNRLTSAHPNIGKFMKENHYEDIFRMKANSGNLYIMARTKSNQYGLLLYNPSSHAVTELIPAKTYISPYNLYVDNQGVLVASYRGYIYYENFSPRYTNTLLESNMGPITDAWFDKGDNLYYTQLVDRMAYTKVFMVPKESPVSDKQLVVGNRSGYVDGIKDEVEMDQAVDFKWDGTGYVFADMGNSALRKLWIDTPPSNR